MPDLIVTAREIRYDKKAIKRGERFIATDKDAKALKLIGKAEDAPPLKPVRKVAETKPAPKVEAEPVVEAAPEPPVPEPEAEPTATRAMTTDDMPEATQGRYRNRALKSED